MTTSYRNMILASRRLAMLRLINEQDGCNESNLNLGIHMLGFKKTTRAETVEDISWLEERKLVTTEVVKDTVLVATITRRGKEAVAGRGEPVDGMEWPE